MEPFNLPTPATDILTISIMSPDFRFLCIYFSSGLTWMPFVHVSSSAGKFLVCGTSVTM